MLYTLIDYVKYRDKSVLDIIRNAINTKIKLQKYYSMPANNKCRSIDNFVVQLSKQLTANEISTTKAQTVLQTRRQQLRKQSYHFIKNQ